MISLRIHKHKIPALCLCMIATFISIVGFVSPQLSTALAIPLAAYIIYKAHPEGLPALAILWIQSIEFISGAEQAAGELPGAIMAFGFPLTLPLVALVCLTCRVLWEAIRRYKTFTINSWVKVSFWLWGGLFVVTVISAMLGRQIGNSNWTQPLRISMSLAAAFYGLIVARRMTNCLWPLAWIHRIASFVLLLILMRLYWSHLGFYYVALGASSVFIFIRQRRWILTLFSLTPLLILCGGGDTLTMLGLVLFGLAVGLYSSNSSHWLLKRIFSVGTWLIFPLGFLMVFAVLFMPALFPMSTVAGNSDLVSRFVFKLFEDRGPLWEAAWKLATSDLKVVTPSGSSLVVESDIINASMELWNIHIHNSFLEMLRQTGFLGATIFLVVFPLLWFRVRSALLLPLPYEVRAFGSAALVASAVGSITGVFPFDLSAGLWIWLFSGMAIGISQYTSIGSINSKQVQRMALVQSQ